MTRLLTLLLLTTWSILLTAQPGNTTGTAFTLQEAINYGMANHPLVRTAQLEMRDADLLIKETKAVALPQINGAINYQYFVKLPVQLVPAQFFDPMAPEGTFAELQFGVANNMTASVEASQLLYDASYFTGLKAAKASKNFSATNLAVQQRTVRTNIINAYMPIVALQENLEVLNRNITNLEKLLFETSELYKAGFVEQLDVDRLDLSLANLRSQLDDLTRQEEALINLLKFAMSYPTEQSVRVEADLEAMAAELPIADLEGPINFQNRPEYRQLEIARLLQNYNTDVIRSQYYPNAAAFANWQEQFQSDDFGEITDGDRWFPTGVIGARINVPIFDGFRRRTQIQRSDIQVDIIDNQRQQLEDAITMEVENARINYRSAQERVTNRRRNLELAERIYNTTQIKYNEGVGSSLEVTQAEQELYAAQANYINAQYDLVVARVNLRVALGYETF